MWLSKQTHEELTSRLSKLESEQQYVRESVISLKHTVDGWFSNGLVGDVRVIFHYLNALERHMKIKFKYASAAAVVIKDRAQKGNAE